MGRIERQGAQEGVAGAQMVLALQLRQAQLVPALAGAGQALRRLGGGRRVHSFNEKTVRARPGARFAGGSQLFPSEEKTVVKFIDQLPADC
jgi:hypothetical protein